MLSSNEFINSMIAAGAAGLTGRIICHPIDTCKAKLQSVDTFRGTLDVISRTLKSEGPRGFYRGVGAVLVGGVPGVCLYMSSYEIAKAYLSSQNALKELPAVSYLIGGMFAEAFCCVLFVPVDVVKERLQVQSIKYTASGQYRSSFHALTTILREEGIRGIYKGYNATVFSYGPFSAIYFLIYEEMKKILKSTMQQEQQHHITASATEDLGFFETLSCSAVAGSIASYVTNPLDLAKLRFQIQKSSKNNSPGLGAPAATEGEIRYRGLVDALVIIYQQQGLRALFRGAWTRVLFFTPSTAITMASYEYFKTMLSPRTS